MAPTLSTASSISSLVQQMQFENDKVYHLNPFVKVMTLYGILLLRTCTSKHVVCGATLKNW